MEEDIFMNYIQHSTYIYIYKYIISMIFCSEHIVKFYQIYIFMIKVYTQDKTNDINSVKGYKS